MAYSNRSYEAVKWFIDTAEKHLNDVRKPNLLFGIAHIFDRNNTRSSQEGAISNAVAQIAATFDPERVVADKEQESIINRPGTISVYAANIQFHGSNPLYDKGLPNVFVRPTDENLSIVDLLYIPDHKDRGISTIPSLHPSVRFAELPGGGFELDLGAWSPAGFEIPTRTTERLSRVVQQIGSTICSPDFRNELHIVKSI